MEHVWFTLGKGSAVLRLTKECQSYTQPSSKYPAWQSARGRDQKSYNQEDRGKRKTRPTIHTTAITAAALGNNQMLKVPMTKSFI